jgi:hypothetical protein
MQFWALCSVLVLGVGVTYPYIHTYILQNPSCNSVHMHTFRELLDAPEAGGPSDPPLLLGHATRPVGNLTYARHEGRSTCTLCMQWDHHKVYVCVTRKRTTVAKRPLTSEEMESASHKVCVCVTRKRTTRLPSGR